MTADPVVHAGSPAGTVADRRQAPKSICILLPVWGDEFINQFLEQSLPTLLAPGNIPALAKTLPTRFVFLTRAGDETTIRAHPAYRRLARVSDVEILPIDDLITQGNHSTTVTLAYTRAMRQTGEAMLDTCFFFLVSDYIMADGSLAAVLSRMQAGASAVQVGNFQIDEETAEPWLLKRLADAGTSLALSPREIMRWAFGCLHQITAANIVNFPLCHNTHANRLLWRVDAETLIGRFYLLHMICIRPEIVDFVVGSSCDYSFVPEMCPSGDVVTITDSDDYLVVEVQPDSHERNFLHLGPGSIGGLARGLSEWTTAGHRANAEQTIVFHAADLPASLPGVVAEADGFIRELGAHLAPEPQPHRNHPYWLGAIAAFGAAVSRREAGGVGPALPPLTRTTLWLRGKLLGQMPEVSRLHPRWKDLQWPLAACRQLAAAPPPHLLVGASRRSALVEWLRRKIPEAVYFSPRRLKRRLPRGIEPGSADLAFIELFDKEISEMDNVLRPVIPLMRPGAEIVVMAFHDYWFADLAEALGSLARSGLWPIEYHIGTESRLRWWINDTTVAVAKALIERPAAFLPLCVAATVFLPLMVRVNLAASWLPYRAPRSRMASSIFVRFRVDAPRSQPPAAAQYPASQ